MRFLRIEAWDTFPTIKCTFTEISNLLISLLGHPKRVAFLWREECILQCYGQNSTRNY